MSYQTNCVDALFEIDTIGRSAGKKKANNRQLAAMDLDWSTAPKQHKKIEKEKREKVVKELKSCSICEKKEKKSNTYNRCQMCEKRLCKECEKEGSGGCVEGRKKHFFELHLADAMFQFEDDCGVERSQTVRMTAEEKKRKMAAYEVAFGDEVGVGSSSTPNVSSSSVDSSSVGSSSSEKNPPKEKQKKKKRKMTLAMFFRH